MSNLKMVKYACYTANLSMAIVGNLSPVLFLIFHDLYGISYSLLGLLILMNFCTQLAVDLLFSFFSYKFNIEKTVRYAPLLTIGGLLLYGLIPWLLPGLTYLGLALGTVVFSAASGLSEVLLSPVIAALPSAHPERDMSKLHSIYAWGVVFVIVFSTVFLHFLGRESWQWLAMIFALIPLLSAILFAGSVLPEMETPEKISDVFSWLKNRELWLSVIAIFLGGASECTMAQWSSSYLEQTFGINKVLGDLCGVAMFSVMLGLGRSLYAKMGRNIERVLLAGFAGAALCYLTAALTAAPLLGLAACACTGFCVSMLWPGSLIVIARRFPAGGVFLYAMMAAGGDLGGSLVPQMVGLVTDAVIARPGLTAASLALTPDQLGMKAGMLAAMLFPLAGIFVSMRILKTRKKAQ